MKILYVGDVMGEVGIETIEKVLPKLKTEHGIDLVLAQAENVSQGKGITPKDFARLQDLGVDFFTGGNHSFAEETIFPMLNDPTKPVIRPANYPVGTPGLGWKYIETTQGKVLVISLLGQTVGKNTELVLDNPLEVVDTILESQKAIDRVATIVNFHGDFSSEKVIIGNFLDGRVTAVVGDHWHIATADARVLPAGTAHITDVGMCGALDSSLGVTFSSVIPRWRYGQLTKNVLETKGPRQFNSVLIESDNEGLAKSIEQIRIIIE